MTIGHIFTVAAMEVWRPRAWASIETRQIDAVKQHKTHGIRSLEQETHNPSEVHLDRAQGYRPIVKCRSDRYTPARVQRQ